MINETVFNYIQARFEEQLALEDVERAKRRYDEAVRKETEAAKELNKMLGDK